MGFIKEKIISEIKKGIIEEVVSEISDAGEKALDKIGKDPEKVERVAAAFSNVAESGKKTYRSTVQTAHMIGEKYQEKIRRKEEERQLSGHSYYTVKKSGPYFKRSDRFPYEASFSYEYPVIGDAGIMIAKICGTENGIRIEGNEGQVFGQLYWEEKKVGKEYQNEEINIYSVSRAISPVRKEKSGKFGLFSYSCTLDGEPLRIDSTLKTIRIYKDDEEIASITGVFHPEYELTSSIDLITVLLVSIAINLCSLLNIDPRENGGY